MVLRATRESIQQKAPLRHKTVIRASFLVSADVDDVTRSLLTTMKEDRT
jgi:hypothetical protein